MNVENTSNKRKQIPYSRVESQLKLIAQDVGRVKKVARIVVIVDSDGSVLHSRVNHRFELNLIAVIGPAYLHQVVVPEAILLEIGISRARPYHEATGKSGKFIQYRRKIFSLTADQSFRLWLTLENFLLNLTLGTVNGWKLKSWRFRHLHKGAMGEREILRGGRFSVAEHDKVLLASILRSEVNRRQTSMEFDTGKASKFLSMILRHYSRRTVQSPKTLAYLSAIPGSGIARAIEFLQKRKFLPHALFLIFRNLERRGCVEVFEKVCTLAGIDADEVDAWGQLMNLKTPLFHGAFVWCVPRRRNGEHHRTLYNPTKKRWEKRGFKKQDFLVFELIPIDTDAE